MYVVAGEAEERGKNEEVIRKYTWQGFGATAKLQTGSKQRSQFLGGVRWGLLLPSLKQTLCSKTRQQGRRGEGDGEFAWHTLDVACPWAFRGGSRQAAGDAERSGIQM